MNNRAELINQIDRGRQIRKLLLYPTELRRHDRINIYEKAPCCTLFCLIIQHLSAYIRVLQEKPTGKPLEKYHWKTETLQTNWIGATC